VVLVISLLGVGEQGVMLIEAPEADGRRTGNGQRGDVAESRGTGVAIPPATRESGLYVQDLDV